MASLISNAAPGRLTFHCGADHWAPGVQRDCPVPHQPHLRDGGKQAAGCAWQRYMGPHVTAGWAHNTHGMQAAKWLVDMTSKNSQTACRAGGRACQPQTGLGPARHRPLWLAQWGGRLHKNLPAVGRGRGWLARGVHGRSSSLQPAAVTSLGVKRRGCPPSRAHHQAPCLPATCLGGEHASATAAGGQPAHHLPRLAGAVAGVDGQCGAAGRLCCSVLGVAGFNHLLQLS